MRLGHLVHCWGQDHSARSINENANILPSRRELELVFGTVQNVTRRSTICTICHELADLSSLSTSINQNDLVVASVLDVDDNDPMRIVSNADFWFHVYFKRPGVPLLDTLSSRFLSRLFVGFEDVPNPAALSSLQRPRPHISWETVNPWLEDCLNNHTAHGSEAVRLPQPPGLRVIDVSRGCIVHAPPSYGSLFRTYLPATIRDAMTVCTETKILYLWVDRLCILQDMHQEKHDQINAMSAIYSNSHVTLVALGGGNIDYGLPGVSAKKRTSTRTCSTQGIFLIQKHASYGEIVQSSVWNTRGWTYQEAILSPRLLLFSDTGVFYECTHRSGVRDEDDTMRDLGVDESMFAVAFSGSNDISTSVKRYAELVGAYTRRTLSYDSDILKAFSGILHAQYSSEHYCGLPFSIFDIAIRWKTRDPRYAKRFKQSGNDFPSWSWASVKGPIQVPYPKMFQGFTTPLAVWARTCHASDSQSQIEIISPRMTQGRKKHKFNSRPGIPSLALVRAWKKGCLSSEIPAILRDAKTWQQEQKTIIKLWQSLDDLILESHGLAGVNIWVEAPCVGFPADDVKRASHPGRILVYAQSLIVRPVPASMPEISTQYTVLQTPDGNTIACLDPESIARRSFQGTVQNSDAPFHAFVLDVGYELAPDLENADLYKCGLASDIEGISSRDSQGESLTWGTTGDACLLYVNLMLVATHDGISKRVALGCAFLEVWTKAKPQFRTFVLE
ncbi:heterokaryon incompatibility protein-domain-containing protein [Aspergillus bertholletiae]|uniref:Heterokaryon incompatibility protein-domain-containing protein n=1 Tax=Aspergillus bertholletiae TaxID=1226010 RepID=A0A5N7B883_9EURO|nr:heterokaryon incompatibility protein-domain-containing protein [Aspergillus bertholletiae]